jgi:hypothetical protein
VKLSDILERRPPEPWADAEKIPWNEPGLSVRMLREHLSQDHDAAAILEKAVESLLPGGLLLLEVHSRDQEVLFVLVACKP